MLFSGDYNLNITSVYDSEVIQTLFLSSLIATLHSQHLCIYVPE